MGIVIGMDEAGYGPNLGPLVVAVTVWEVPGAPRDTDFWGAFSNVVTQAPSNDPARLHVADSKQVYSPARGIGPLERGVHSGLSLCGDRATSFRALCDQLAGDSAVPLDSEPWFAGRDLDLPQVDPLAHLDETVARWNDCCADHGIRLKAIRSDVVLTERFNRLNREHGSKGITLSRISLALLRSVWNPEDSQPALVIADKHGGRNRYDMLLAEVVDGQMIFRMEEGTHLSSYRVGATSIRFQTKAEAHLPVALASMVAKYVRELSMTLFNQFWAEHVPRLKPTKGYPVDAKRFRQDIAAVQQDLGIDDEILWRER